MIESPNGEAYYVVGDDLLYVYEPPELGSHSADSSMDSGQGDDPRDESTDDARDAP